MDGIWQSAIDYDGIEQKVVTNLPIFHRSSHMIKRFVFGPTERAYSKSPFTLFHKLSLLGQSTHDRHVFEKTNYCTEFHLNKTTRKQLIIFQRVKNDSVFEKYVTDFDIGIYTF